MRLTDLANDSADLATRIANVLPSRLLDLRDMMAGQPRAHSFDPNGKGSHQWCWVHERDVDQCHRDELECTGETFVLHDPTGEAAVSNDTAAKDCRAVGRSLLIVHRELDRVADLLARYQPSRADIPRAGIGTCTDCHRYFDGQNGKLTVYKGTDPVCDACRKRRDRATSDPCASGHLRVRWHVGANGYGCNKCEVCGVEVAA